MANKLLAGFVLLLSLSLVSAAITGSETLTATSPITVGAGQAFSLTYTAQNTNGNWGATIMESATGGCLFPSGTNELRTVMLSDDGLTKTIQVTAPSSGSCTISGDYQFGSSQVKQFSNVVITVSANTCPTGQTMCSDGICKADCGGGNNNIWLYVAIGAGVLVLLVIISRKK